MFYPCQNVVETFCTVLVLEQPQGTWGCCKIKTGQKGRNDILSQTKCRYSSTKYHSDILTRAKCHYDILTRTNYRRVILAGTNHHNVILARPKCRYDILYRYNVILSIRQNVVATFCPVLIVQQPPQILFCLGF